MRYRILIDGLRWPKGAVVDVHSQVLRGVCQQRGLDIFDCAVPEDLGPHHSERRLPLDPVGIVLDDRAAQPSLLAEGDATMSSAAITRTLALCKQRQMEAGAKASHKLIEIRSERAEQRFVGIDEDRPRHQSRAVTLWRQSSADALHAGAEAEQLRQELALVAEFAEIRPDDELRELAVNLVCHDVTLELLAQGKWGVLRYVRGPAAEELGRQFMAALADRGESLQSPATRRLLEWASEHVSAHVDRGGVPQHNGDAEGVGTPA